MEKHAKLATTNKKIKETEKALDDKLYAKYPTLSEDEIKILVVDDKWLASVKNALQEEVEKISQTLTNRIKELAERYDTPLPALVDTVAILENTVNEHLVKMGFSWS